MPPKVTILRAALLDVVREHLDGKCIVYRTTIGGKLESQAIELHSHFLVSLRKIAPRIPLKVLESCIMEVAVEKESSWHLAGEKQGFSEQSSKAIRSMMSDIAQTLCKVRCRKPPGKPPPWCVQFDELQGEAQQEHEPGESQAEAQPEPVPKKPRPEAQQEQGPMDPQPAAQKKRRAPQPEPTYKFDDARWKACRELPDGDVEWADPEIVDPDDDDAELVAKFPDYTWSIPGLTTRDHKIMQGQLPPEKSKGVGKTRGASDSLKWSGSHDDGGVVEVRVSKRKGERSLILWHVTPAKRSQIIEAKLQTVRAEAVAAFENEFFELAKRFVAGATKKDLMLIKNELIAKYSEPDVDTAATQVAPSTSPTTCHTINSRSDRTAI